MASRYWVGGTATWDTTSTANWSAAQGLSFTASCSGTTLTTVGSPALVVGMRVWSSANVTLGTIVSGAVNTWVVSVGGTYASQTMTAATTGASVPTTADNVIITTGSGTTAGTISMTGALNCNSFTVSVTGWSFIFGTSPTLVIAGKDASNYSFNVASGTTMNFAVPTTFTSTSTGNIIVTNGVSVSFVFTFDGVGGVWTLGSALNNSANTITVTNGTFDTSSTGNYALTVNSFASANSNVRTINLNASTVTVSSTLTAWNLVTTTNLTFNAGTSTIVMTAGSGTSTFSGGGLTYYNVTSTANSASSVTRTINGANTFNNLTITNTNSSNGWMGLNFGASQTITGTLTISGGTTTPGTNRIYAVSSTYGTQVTLTAAAVSLTDVDFTDIVGAGAASPFTGTRLGDGANNSGITFPVAKTVYFVGTTSANWGASLWATSSGGAVSSTNFPLPQDTAVIDNSSLNTSATLSLATGYNLSTIDFSARSNAITFSTATLTPNMYGSITLSSAVTLTGTGILTWQNRSTATITSATVSWTQPITVDNKTGTVRLGDNFTSTNATTALTLTSGTFDANGFNFTGVKVVATGTVSRTLAVGSGTWTISGVTTTTWQASATGLTVTGSGTISMTGATAKTFVGASVNYGSVVLNQGGAGALTVSGSNTFGDITNTYAATGATSILFTSGTTQTVAAFTASGAAAKLLTLNAVTAGSAFTLSKASGIVSSDYLSLKDSTATGGATWYAGANSTNTSGNTGWVFTAPLNVTGVAATGAVGTVAVNYDFSQSVTGETATGAVGTVAVNYDANVSVTGVAATGAVGTVAVVVDVNVSVTGETATGAVGTVAVNYDANVSVTGETATGAVGTVTPFIGTIAIVTGVEATGAVGIASVAIDATATVTGETATGAAGTVTVNYDFSQSVVGETATGAVGTVVVSTIQPVPVTGVEATGAIGTVDTNYSANVSLTGKVATGAVGTATVETFQIVFPTGVFATGAVGDVTEAYGANVYIIGFEAIGYVGNTLVWGQVIPDPGTSWSTIVPSQTPVWTQIVP